MSQFFLLACYIVRCYFFHYFQYYEFILIFLRCDTAQNEVSIKDLVTFAAELLNEKLHFLCSVFREYYGQN